MTNIRFTAEVENEIVRFNPTNGAVTRFPLTPKPAQ
jgi:hypothetical protein